MGEGLETFGMPKNGQVVGGGRGKMKVVELSADCLNVGLAPTGGWRATLAVNIQIEGPDGQRFRGAGSRLHVRVYPIRPTKDEAPAPRAKKKAKASGAKRQAAAKR